MIMTVSILTVYNIVARSLIRQEHYYMIKNSYKPQVNVIAIYPILVSF
jgi:hypothetical protein